jgi:hypothetical protein
MIQLSRKSAANRQQDVLYHETVCRRAKMRVRVLIALVVPLAGASPTLAEPKRSTMAQATPPATPAVCPMIYKPVCGHDRSGKQTTYSNECMARAAGATHIYPGTCVADITR